MFGCVVPSIITLFAIDVVLTRLIMDVFPLVHNDPITCHAFRNNANVYGETSRHMRIPITKDQQWRHLLFLLLFCKKHFPKSRDTDLRRHYARVKRRVTCNIYPPFLLLHAHINLDLRTCVVTGDTVSFDNHHKLEKRQMLYFDYRIIKFYYGWCIIAATYCSICGWHCVWYFMHSFQRSDEKNPHWWIT